MDRLVTPFDIRFYWDAAKGYALPAWSKDEQNNHYDRSQRFPTMEINGNLTVRREDSAHALTTHKIPESTVPLGVPRPVQGSQPGPALYAPLLPLMMSLNPAPPIPWL